MSTAAADYIAAAPSLDAWAGDSAAVAAIYASADLDRRAEFAGRCATAIDVLIAEGATVDEAVAGYDPEDIARDLIVESEILPSTILRELSTAYEDVDRVCYRDPYDPYGDDNALVRGDVMIVLSTDRGVDLDNDLDDDGRLILTYSVYDRDGDGDNWKLRTTDGGYPEQVRADALHVLGLG